MQRGRWEVKGNGCSFLFHLATIGTLKTKLSLLFFDLQTRSVSSSFVSFVTIISKKNNIMFKMETASP